MTTEKSGQHVHHVHHKSGHHAHHRHHSGHRHENGHHRVPPVDVLDEEVVEDMEEEPTRAHVDVHNAEQFWAGKLELQYHDLDVY